MIVVEEVYRLIVAISFRRARVLSCRGHTWAPRHSVLYSGNKSAQTKARYQLTLPLRRTRFEGCRAAKTAAGNAAGFLGHRLPSLSGRLRRVRDGRFRPGCGVLERSSIFLYLSTRCLRD